MAQSGQTAFAKIPGSQKPTGANGLPAFAASKDVTEEKAVAPGATGGNDLAAVFHDDIGLIDFLLDSHSLEGAEAACWSAPHNNNIEKLSHDVCATVTHSEPPCMALPARRLRPHASLRRTGFDRMTRNAQSRVRGEVRSCRTREETLRDAS